MSNFYEDSDVAPTRSGATQAAQQQGQPHVQQGPPYQSYQQYPGPQQYPAYGYGYPQERPFSAFRQHWPTETKPFFLTSEFALVVLTIIGLAITAATSSTVDARYFWAATSALVIGYVISRGIAKSGSKSHASDPRDQLDLANRFGGNDNDQR